MSQTKAPNLYFSTQKSILTPTTEYSPLECHILSILFEGLTRVDEKEDIVPGIAEKYTVSEDLETYTFTLRESFWSNGMPLTAHDFEYAWKKCIDPRTGSLGAPLFYIIKNASLAAHGQAPMSEVGIKVLDPYILKIELEHPVPHLLELLGDCTFFLPIPKHLDEIDSSWAHLRGQKFVCNGPFTIKGWRQEEEANR